MSEDTVVTNNDVVEESTELTGMQALMHDLGVSSYEELAQYIHDLAHKDEPIVQEFLSLFSMKDLSLSSEL